jgi:LPXTG-motif cell wall-anchored protein
MKIFPVTKRILSGLCVWLIAFCIFYSVTPVWAAENGTEAKENGSITVKYVLPEASFSVYLIADVSGSYNGKFKDCTADLSKKDDINTLVNYISENNIEAADTRNTDKEADKDGKYNVVFENLKTGIYLVTGAPKWSDGTKYTPNNALLMIAQTSLSDDTSLEALYDTEITLNGLTQPKYTTFTPSEGSVDNNVDLVGENPPDDDVNLGGDSVDQINEGNKTDTVNTVNSSPLGDDEVTTVKSSQDRLGASLPQTGQLWWPVFVLAGTGLSSLTIGVRRRRNTK